MRNGLKYFGIFMIFLLSHTVNGQKEKRLVGKPVNLDNIIFFSDNIGTYGSKYSSEFLYPRWEKGELVTLKQDTFSDIDILYSVAGNLLFVKTGEDDPIQVTNHTIKNFTIYSDEKRYSLISADGTLIFAEELFDGKKYGVYAQKQKKKENGQSEGYTVIGHLDYYDSVDKLFIRLDKFLFERIPSNKKEFANLFSDPKKLTTCMKENKLGVKHVKDLIQLIAFADEQQL